MEVLAIESAAFQKMQEMYQEIYKQAIELGKENKKLKEVKWLTAEQASERINGIYTKETILAKKHDIGFESHGKVIVFRAEDVDTWMNRDYNPPRALKVVQRHYK